MGIYIYIEREREKKILISYRIINLTPKKSGMKRRICFLFRPTNIPYIKSNVYFVKYSDIFNCIYTILFIISFTYLNSKYSIQDCTHRIDSSIFYRQYIKPPT